MNQKFMNLKSQKLIKRFPFFIVVNFLFFTFSWSQNQGGDLQLGVRSTVSLFNDSKTNDFGKGIGGTAPE